MTHDLACAACLVVQMRLGLLSRKVLIGPDLPTPVLSMLLTYILPVVPSRLLAPENKWLQTRIRARSPNSRLKASFLLHWPIALLILWVGTMLGALESHALRSATPIRGTVLVPVLMCLFLNFFVFFGRIPFPVHTSFFSLFPNFWV